MMGTGKARTDEHESGNQPSEHYIGAEVSLVDRPMHTLMEGDAFAVLDSNGDLGRPGAPEGLFFRDTRYLSRFAMRFEGKRLLLLGSVLQDDNAALTVNLANPDIRPQEEDGIPRDAISIERTIFLWEGACHERIGFRSFDTRSLTFCIEVQFDADFRDLFEVRGVDRMKRGQVSATVSGPCAVTFRYLGLDGAERRTILSFSRVPESLDTKKAVFKVTIPAGGRASLLVRTLCEEGAPRDAADFVTAFRDKRRAIRAATRDLASVESTHALFNEIVCRSASDITMLSTTTEYGQYPYAGIPWYSTIFGRDGIITAMQLLWVNPALAAGVLRYLAATQATTVDPASDAQPGKILHERRDCEMARTGEVPFWRYYGTIDATPLFLMLAGLYFERTGDLGLIRDIWGPIRAALAWCETSGDRDGDGFIEYHRETEHGLANQGWKDSHDSISHADGSLARGPIALCEVQAYYHSALGHAAGLARAMDDDALAARLDETAATLRRQFEEQFWCEEIGTYVLALDGEKRPCKVRSSNAGHALFAGIASPERAARTAQTLLSVDGFSGWGIRTLARGEKRYNPMSYHNGSVWPHDNAMIIAGFARYGLKAEAAKVSQALFDAAGYQEHRRLPELFCGFLRRRRHGPVRYPVACSPQAWAAAAPFGLLAACLGLHLSARDNEAFLRNPILPEKLDGLTLRNLGIGTGRVDLRVERHGSGAAVSVLRKSNDMQVLVQA
jgi:glycogen debranching enzyme